MTLRTLMVSVDAVLSGAGFKRAPGLFSAASLPLTCVDNAWCVLVQSDDTGEYRESGDNELRARQTVTISILKQLRPGAQFDSLCDSGDAEELIMAAMVQRAAFPDAFVRWLTTRRSAVPGREYLVIDLAFAIEHDWAFASPSTATPG